MNIVRKSLFMSSLHFYVCLFSFPWRILFKSFYFTLPFMSSKFFLYSSCLLSQAQQCLAMQFQTTRWERRLEDLWDDYILPIIFQSNKIFKLFYFFFFLFTEFKLLNSRSLTHFYVSWAMLILTVSF